MMKRTSLPYLNMNETSIEKCFGFVCPEMALVVDNLGQDYATGLEIDAIKLDSNCRNIRFRC